MLSAITLYQKFFLQAKQIQKSQRISNLCLASRALRGEPQNQWAALGAAHEKVGKIPESQIVEDIYDFVRTHFIKNSWLCEVPRRRRGIPVRVGGCGDSFSPNPLFLAAAVSALRFQQNRRLSAAGNFGNNFLFALSLFNC